MRSVNRTLLNLVRMEGLRSLRGRRGRCWPAAVAASRVGRGSLESGCYGAVGRQGAALGRLRLPLPQEVEAVLDDPVGHGRPQRRPLPPRHLVVEVHEVVLLAARIIRVEVQCWLDAMFC